MRKFLTILFLIMLIISFFQITSMYALYKEQIQGEYNTLLGSWEIKVNGTEVASTGQVETFTIANNQLGYVDSQYIQAGKIAPNGQAYFDIVIDPANTDVSIIYEVEIDKNAISSTNTDLEFLDSIQLISGENYFGQGENGQTNKTVNELEYTNEEKNTYTSIIPIGKITEGYKNYVRVYFQWKNVTEIQKETIEVDGEQEEVEKEVELNNDQDTELGITENSKLTLPIKLNLKQYMGEVIDNVS